MAHVGTGYVDIQPDLSAFGRELSAKIKAALAAEPNANVEVTPDVDRSAARSLGRRLLSALGHQKVTVDVDVDTNRLRRTIGSKIETALGGLAAGLSGLLGNIPGIGGLFSGLTSAFGSTVLGASAATAAILGLGAVLAALVASLAAAVAGAAALGVALAAAAGPAVIVAVGAFAKLAQIIKAVKDHEANAGAEARGLAGSHQQLTAATDAVSQAQANLKEQTTAAFGAWADAIENVKDDLLGLKDAQLGIAESRLGLRQAKQDLRDFKREIGGTNLDAVFKKFTDVNVDTSGLTSALANARGTGGKKLTGDQELELERRILAVRQAKLQEAHATDTLHDSTVKLSADRKTEADFARRGVAAYKPYRDATLQLAGAQRSLAGAQLSVANAAARQNKAWKDLSPAERQFGKFLITLGDTLDKVFTPVMSALLQGVTRGLRDFAKAAADPKIGKALVTTGRALGDAFATIAKTLTSPEMRQAFVDFAKAGVRIIKTFGTKVFDDLALSLTRLAQVALPLLIQFLDKITKWFDGLEHSSRNTKNLRDDVTHLVDAFNAWFTLLTKTAVALVKVGGFLEPIGTGIVRFLTHPLESFGKAIGFSGQEIDKLRTVFAPLERVVVGAFKGILDSFRGTFQVMRGILRIFIGVFTGDFHEAWKGVKDIFRGGLKFIKGVFEQAIAPFRAIGKNLGKAIINGLIGIINIGIRALNKVLGPRSLGPLGHTPDLRLGEITPIGAKKPGVQIHDRKTVPKLSPAHAPSGRTIRASAASFVIPALAGVGGGRSTVIEHQEINVRTPSGRLPDPRQVAIGIAREIDKR
jgi:hypothetical protein